MDVGDKPSFAKPAERRKRNVAPVEQIRVASFRLERESRNDLGRLPASLVPFEDVRVTLPSLHRHLVASLLLVGVVGCAPKDEIRVYKADSEPAYNEIRKPVTLLAVIVPQTERMNWVFKVAGPEAEIAAQRDAILEFFKTVQFVKDDPKNDDDEPALVWQLPKTWIERPGDKKIRYKSISIPGKGDPLDLSVSLFDKRGGRILPNVNRWRKQIYRNEISERELPLITKTLPMAGVEATVVEMKGFEITQPEEREPFEYKLPEGWKKGTKVPFGLLSFRVEDGQKRATVSVTAAGGTLEDNLNRWREQVQLPKLDKDELLKTTKTLKIAGQDAVYVDYAGPADKDAKKEPSRILGAIVRLQDAQLFVKMTGPVDLVEREKANFERFATSLALTKEDK